MRWGNLLANHRAWRRNFRRLRPETVIVARSIPSTEVAALAATSLGVNVVSIPHGVVEVVWPATRKAVATGRIVHAMPVVLTALEESVGFRSCSSALVAYEYPRTKGQKAETWDLAPTVLVLVDHGNILHNGLRDGRQQAHFLESLAARCPGVTLALKDHPSRPIFASCLSQDAPSNLMVLHPAEDLHVALQNACGVILFNYWGSAAVHAIATDLPVARFAVGRGLSGGPSEWEVGALAALREQIPVCRSLEQAQEFVQSVSSANAGTRWTHRPRELLAVNSPTLVELLNSV